MVEARGAAARAGRRSRRPPRTRAPRRGCSTAGAARPGRAAGRRRTGRAAAGGPRSAGPRRRRARRRPPAGASGSSSRTRNTVLTGSSPGTAAICTASTRNLAHSTVSCGQRPISRKPYSDPPDCSGATSIDDGRPCHGDLQLGGADAPPGHGDDAAPERAGTIVSSPGLADKRVSSASRPRHGCGARCRWGRRDADHGTPATGSSTTACRVQGGAASSSRTVPPARAASSAGDGQPEPGTAGVAAAGVVEPGEALEHPLPVLGGHARARRR